MPELPEVETVRKTLEKLIIGKTIDRVTVSLPRIIQKPYTPDKFAQTLKEKTITKIGRRGKFLKIFVSPYVLISHLRMEGKYRLTPKEEPIAKHTHVIFHFSDGTELRYQDVRQFGTMHLFLEGEEDQQAPLKKLGPEPLSNQFNLDWFYENLQKRKTKIKSLLLNQEFLVGLGNIYVDESLFEAKIHPERPANSLSKKEAELLFHSIQSTLQKGIKAGGASVRSYRNGAGEMGYFQLQLRVYGRKEEPCFVCGSPISRIVVAGRGTHICSQCQKI